MFRKDLNELVEAQQAHIRFLRDEKELYRKKYEDVVIEKRRLKVALLDAVNHANKEDVKLSILNEIKGVLNA